MLSARSYFEAIHTVMGARIQVESGNLTALYLNGMVKYLLKKYVLGKRNLDLVSLRDWKSRAHYARFDNSHARGVLGWQPETERAAFVAKAIGDANLFGF